MELSLLLYWVDLTASVIRRGRTFQLQAEKVKKIPQPRHPSLYFSDGL